MVNLRSLSPRNLINRYVTRKDARYWLAKELPGLQRQDISEIFKIIKSENYYVGAHSAGDCPAEDIMRNGLKLTGHSKDYMSGAKDEEIMLWKNIEFGNLGG